MQIFNTRDRPYILLAHRIQESMFHMCIFSTPYYHYHHRYYHYYQRRCYGLAIGEDDSTGMVNQIVIIE